MQNRIDFFLFYILSFSTVILTIALQNKSSSSTSISSHYLLLTHAHEGITKWKDTVASFFHVAVKFNRTAVLPCITNGRISSCELPNAVPLPMIINMDDMYFLFPGLTTTSHVEFKRNCNASILYCIDLKDMKENLAFDLTRTNPNLFVLSRMLANERIVPFNSSYETCVAENGNELAVALLNPWYKNILANNSDFRHVKLTFHPNNADIVRWILAAHHIDPLDYEVFQWRSETVDSANILDCAKVLLHKALAALKKSKHHKLVLLSDIPFAANLTLWGFMPKDDENRTSAAKLLSKSFFKIETSHLRNTLIKVNPMYNDSIFLTVWDIIIAMQAKQFTTCIDIKSDICLRCARYDSKFAKLIVKQRKDLLNKASSIAW